MIGWRAPSAVLLAEQLGLVLVAQSAPLMVFLAFPIGRAAVAFTTATIVSTAIDR